MRRAWYRSTRYGDVGWKPRALPRGRSFYQQAAVLLRKDLGLPASVLDQRTVNLKNEVINGAAIQRLNNHVLIRRNTLEHTRQDFSLEARGPPLLRVPFQGPFGRKWVSRPTGGQGLPRGTTRSLVWPVLLQLSIKGACCLPRRSTPPRDGLNSQMRGRWQYTGCHARQTVGEALALP